MLFIKRTYSTSLTNPSPKHNIIPISSQIINLCKSGSLHQALKLLNTANSTQFSLNVKPLVYASLLQTATKLKSLNHGLQLHSHITKSSLIANSLVGNSLLSLYYKLGSSNLLEPTKIFNELLLVRDVISWTCMISGYVRVKPRKALEFFGRMLGDGVSANAFALSAGIKACCEVGDVQVGKCFHGFVLRGGFELNCVVVSALIDMYGKNGWLDYARLVFEEMPELADHDAICWSSVISALTKNDCYEEALLYFYVMLREYELVPDDFTYGSVLMACGNSGRLKQGREVHSKVITLGLCGNVVVESSLVDMYGKCGRVRDSQSVFDTMRKKNAVSWCALLNGYCQNELYQKVIELFRKMENPDLYSFGTIIRACAGLAAVRHGKEVHCRYIRRRGGKGYVIVESALIDLYAKCGCIDHAERLFQRMPVRNLISWNSMISGFAQNGRGLEAIGLFEQMVNEGIRPDYISFVGVIFACSHAGLVDLGKQYFVSMAEEYGIKPGSEHYHCVVDLLGRAGLIEEAENLIEKAEVKDSFALWPPLLGACSTSRDSAAIERIALKMMMVQPENHLSYVHLINMYKSAGRWDDAMRIRKLMEDRGLKKLPGKSWVQSDMPSETNPSFAEAVLC